MELHALVERLAERIGRALDQLGGFSSARIEESLALTRAFDDPHGVDRLMTLLGSR